jgi:IclR family acetate operon transcriptional repressor
MRRVKRSERAGRRPMVCCVYGNERSFIYMNAVKSALRVLEVLEHLAAAPEPVGVSEISRELAIPKSSAFMLLSTLESRGYVEGDPQRRFSLNRIFTEGRPWVGGSYAALMRAARPAMQALAHSTGESSFLGVARDAQTAEYIAKVVSGHEVRCDAELHEPRPLHSTSVGMVLLAFQDEELTGRFLASRLERVTPKTLYEPRQLRRELAAIRERGFAIARDTNSAGASGIAAPVFTGKGRVIAALNLAAPTSRFETMLRRGSEDLLRATRALTRELSA